MRFFQAFAGDPTSCPVELSLVGSLGVDGDGRAGLLGHGLLLRVGRSRGAGPAAAASFGPPNVDSVELQPFTALQAANDAGYPPAATTTGRRAI